MLTFQKFISILKFDGQSVDSCLGSAVFTHSKVALWQATIVENTLKRLAALNKPFKYVGELRADE
jgi:hypothetical protein